MDIHKSKPWHGWRELAKEIGTIVIGVLIALGAEQTVEMIHRQRDGMALREALQRETDQILLDTVRVEKSEHAEIIWEQQVEATLASANKSRQALGRLPPEPRLDFDVPDDPIYQGAQSSGKLTLLSNEEREAYGELDALIRKVSGAYDQREGAIAAAIENQRHVGFGQPTGSAAIFHDGSLSPGVGFNGSSQDLEKLFDGAVRVELRVEKFEFWSRQARGATTALHSGERGLQKIQAAERQFDGLP